MNTLQLHLGFPQPPMTYPYSLVSKYIKPSWLTSTWSFLLAVQGTIILSDPWVLQLDWVHNSFLMPTVSALAATPFLSTSDLICFNQQCRMYLQILTLSDIVDSSGQALVWQPQFPKILCFVPPSRSALVPPSAGAYGGEFSPPFIRVPGNAPHFSDQNFA